MAKNLSTRGIPIILASRESIWGGGEVFLHGIGLELRSRGFNVQMRVPNPSQLLTNSEGLITNSPSGRFTSKILVANDFRSLWKSLLLDRRCRRVFVIHGPWQVSPVRIFICKLFKVDCFVVNKNLQGLVSSMGMRAANLLPLGPKRVGVSNPRRLNPDVKKIIFGQVARFDPIKRLDFFANTVNALGARGVLVCPPSNSLEQKRFAERALEMGVQVYSHGDPSQVWDGCDVYFSSSSYESLGLSMLEALSSGIPVLTTAAGGPREIFSGMLCAGIVSKNPTTDEILIALNKISDNWTQYWIDANNLLESRSIQKCTDMILEHING